jgi:hypothetical protein
MCPKQEVVVRQLRGDMRTFARALIDECPSESRQLPVGFQSTEPGLCLHHFMAAHPQYRRGLARIDTRSLPAQGEQRRSPSFNFACVCGIPNFVLGEGPFSIGSLQADSCVRSVRNEQLI